MFGPHHGAYGPNGWNGGFGHVHPNTYWNGGPIGNYQPGYMYPMGHPYHHDNFFWGGQPIGIYQPGYAYPPGHPYYGVYL